MGWAVLNKSVKETHKSKRKAADFKLFGHKFLFKYAKHVELIFFMRYNIFMLLFIFAGDNLYVN